MESLVQILRSCGDLFAHCFVITDLEAADSPLIYVNDNFCRLSGYSREEVLGKNCRFLQGSDTNSADIALIAAAIKERECCYQDILNYKKDGTPFWNRLMLIPINTDVLGVRYYIGIQHDITDKVMARNSLIAKGPSTSKGVVFSKVNNPLTSIVRNLRGLRYQVDGSDQSQKLTQELIQKVQAEITGLCTYVHSLD